MIKGSCSTAQATKMNQTSGEPTESGEPVGANERSNSIVSSHLPTLGRFGDQQLRAADDPADRSAPSLTPPVRTRDASRRGRAGADKPARDGAREKLVVGLKATLESEDLDDQSKSRLSSVIAFLDGAVARCATVAPRLTICVLVKDAIAPGVKDLIG